MDNECKQSWLTSKMILQPIKNKKKSAEGGEISLTNLGARRSTYPMRVLPGYTALGDKTAVFGRKGTLVTLQDSQAEAFDAETVATLQGLQTTLQSRQTHFIRRIRVIVKVVRQTTTPCLRFSRATAHALHETAKGWKRRPDNVFPTRDQIFVYWILRNTGIKDDEIHVTPNMVVRPAPMQIPNSAAWPP